MASFSGILKAGLRWAAPLLFLGAGLSLSAQPIPCDHTAWLIKNDQFRNLDLSSFAQNTPALSAPLVVNAMGYNVRDEKIYGLHPQTLHLMRVDGAGLVEDLGLPEGIDPDFRYVAGDVSPDGRRLFVLAQNPATGFDERLYTIRLNPPYFAGFVSITGVAPVALADVAFDPFFDKAYGYDNRQKKIVSISSGGNVTGFSTTSTPYVLGGLFFDQWGTLFGTGGGNLIEFNKHTGEVISVRKVDSGDDDGCSCPYQLEFFQTISPAEIMPCSEAIVTCYFNNRAGTVYGGVGIETILPAGFTITEILTAPFFGTIESGVGTSVFEVANMQVLLGVDSFSFRVYLDETVGGTYDIQSAAFEFPQAFGKVLLSDNPATPDAKDPNPVRILDAESDLIPEDQLFLCEGGHLTLTTGQNGVSFLWSDGSEGPTLEVTQPGNYWVEVHTDCRVYKDFIVVEMTPEPLFADLGEDLILSYGEAYRLAVATNAGNAQYAWSGDVPAYLSCLDCPAPTIRPLSGGVFSVTVTDEQGCQAFDEVAIEVVKEVAVYAPNVFSPNGDGINDHFFLQSGGQFDLESLRIFDRWGSLIFEQKNLPVNAPEVGWDGTLGGRKVPAGVYLWYAEIVFPQKKAFSGSVLVIK
ncbi:MAG: gliding motility-associated C-terminal domain-containing protein [Bacteroidetes bacterium]|nr:MAG: gliding motility-associated C-terminal domain-containing protein [Bacteroidota bacterium]